nr:uncharacterized protein LOC100178834 [Ciona intestinalis]|eukprot:XP_002123912.1 uncharacterized protein LOC100178834 [Ciona intestinalis]
MLKNRDTSSNPYRVPPQPTSTWVKVAIGILFVAVLALMATVVYLTVIMQSMCATTCPVNNEPSSRKVAVVDKAVIMADQGSGGQSGNKNIRQLVNRIDRIGEAVSRIQNDVTELDSYCRTLRLRDGAPTRSSSPLSPKDVAVLQKIPKLETFTRGLDAKLTRYMTQQQHICDEHHYRYGLYCYVVVEASLSQSEARNGCVTNFGNDATLAIVKDQLTQNFISTKLPNLVHSYWIGLDRVPAGQSMTSPAPSSVRNGVFEYSDGTRVQRHVWQMWLPRSDVDGNSPTGNCASMTYDHVTSEWRWREQDCSARLNYICQYFIMS